MAVSLLQKLVGTWELLDLWQLSFVILRRKGKCVDMRFSCVLYISVHTYNILTYCLGILTHLSQHINIIYSDSTTPCLNIIGMYTHTREGSRKSSPRLTAVSSMLQLPEERSSLLGELYSLCTCEVLVSPSYHLIIISTTSSQQVH